MARRKAPPPPAGIAGTSAEITARLERGALRLDAATAAAIRDHAAAYLLADPSQADGVSRALLHAVHAQDRADASTWAIAWRCRAEASLFSGRLRMARRAYEKATTAAEASRDRDLLGQILVGRVHLHALMNEGPVADELARKAERLLARTRNWAYLGKLHMNRGNAFYQKEDYRRARDAYARAAAIFDRAGIRDATWVGLLINQAIVTKNLGRLDEALGLYRRADTHAHALNLESLTAHVRYDRAFLEALRGDYHLALELLDDAEGIFERQAVLDMKAACQRARADIYLDLGMAGEAIELSARAGEAFAGQQMTLDAVLARMQQARGLVMAGRASEALPLLEHAERFFAREKRTPRSAAVLLLRARAALASGAADRAAASARRAQMRFKRLGMTRAESQATRLLAEALAALGRRAVAARTLDSALVVAASQPVAERMELWALAGRISLGRGREREARTRLGRAARDLELFRQLIPGPELRARAFEQAVGIYYDLVDLALAKERAGLGPLFRLIESARARGFRDRMESAPAASRGEVTSLRAQLGERLRRLEEAEFGAQAPDPAALRVEQKRVRALEREIADRLRRAEARRGKPSSAGRAPDLERVARRLRPDETLVEYFIGRGRMIALVLRRDGRSLVRLGTPPERVREEVRRLAFQLEVMALSARGPHGNPEFALRSTREVLQALHEALLAPLSASLPRTGRLIVVPHLFLHAVPFECLWDGEEYVDRRYILSRCPSADFVVRGRPAHVARDRSSRRALGDGVVIAGTVTAAPACIGDEITQVGAFFPSARTRVLRDPTREQLLDALSSCRLMHLSTHAVFRDDNPLFSRLSTADGALFLADILDRSVKAELVVLSACNTGLAFTGKSDDLSGVAHGFLAAGARRLVASLWRVNDEATRELMAAFYRHLTAAGRQGERAGARNPAGLDDPAAALAAAGRELRRRFPHPFFWGGFSVHGR